MLESGLDQILGADHFSPMQIVLVHPQIPPNTGNVARLCAATRSTLHIVRPAGFRLDDRAARRAGLDYWEHVERVTHADWNAFLEWRADSPNANGRLWLFTKTAQRSHIDADFDSDDFLVFGSETEGLPESILEPGRADGSALRIPILNPAVRSLNLADSVAIALYRALERVGALR